MITNQKNISIFEKFPSPMTINHTRTRAKKVENHSVHGISVSAPRWLKQLTKSSFSFPFYILSVCSKATLVSNDDIEWSLGFGLDSFTLIVKDLVQEKTTNSQVISLVAWSLLLFERQDFLNKQPAQVSITPNQGGSMELRNEVLSSVRAQEMDTSRYQMSDLDDFEFYWENDQLDVYAVFILGMHTPFSPTAFLDLEMGGSAENPILLDEEEDNSNSPPIAPVSDRPTRRPDLLRSFPSGTRIEKLRIVCIEICLDKFYCVCVLT